jgi:hypothetical protein
LVAEEMFCWWEWWMGWLLAPDHGPFLYTPFFHFWSGEADRGRGVFFSSLSSHSTWVVPLFSPLSAFSPFLLTCFSSWSFPSLVIQISLNKFFSFHGPASMTWTCRVLSTLNNFLKNCVPWRTELQYKTKCYKMQARNILNQGKVSKDQGFRAHNSAYKL